MHTSAPENQNSSAPYLIKKYPNRRLYDTVSSSYITLQQVKELIMQRKKIAVRDAKTDEDLTRSILLQIIFEEEAGGSPFFTEVMLTNIICFYGHAMQGIMGSQLEKQLQILADFQSQMAQHAAQHPAWNTLLHMQKINTQFQDNLKKQTESMMALFGIRSSQ